MDTLRVDICYRPLRIGWVIKSGDFGAFREAVRLSHAFWGGRFNPILVADRFEEAKRLADCFRVDLLLPVGGSEEVKSFPKRFPYLSNPFFHDSVFVGGGKEGARSNVLDVHNALVHLRDQPEKRELIDGGFRLYTWQANEQLADIFLMQLGSYPEAEPLGIDYRSMVSKVLEPREVALDALSPIPAETVSHRSIAYLSRHGVRRHYSIANGLSVPGFFVGSVGNLDDLICYWNLRAADIPLWFVDPQHIERYSEVIPAWEDAMRTLVAHRHESARQLAIWTLGADPDVALACFPAKELAVIQTSEHTWNGLNVRPPMMILDEASALGVVGRPYGTPRVSFPLTEKPFCGDSWFHTQHLVASLSFIGGLFGDNNHTLYPPYVPELNESCARLMHFDPRKLRLESGRIGVVIKSTDTDAWLNAWPVNDLMDRVFRLAGYSSALSNGGLIARQLIARLGGLQGVRPFKIHGVRRLIQSYGPTQSFSKQAALQMIGGQDPAHPSKKFSDHEDLYIGPRPSGSKLTADLVFSYLVQQGLFRIGYDLICEHCRLASWTALEGLRHRVVCDLCGEEYEATAQLVRGTWSYRRSGILGAEKNAMGAIPVALTLQQIDANLGGALGEAAYSLSLNLTPEGATTNSCELDFVWVIPRPYPRRTAIIIGECKDVGPIKIEDFSRDIATLKKLARALPAERFKAFVLVSKLSQFSPDEIECLRILNTGDKQRAILLTARELEPYLIYDRTKTEFDIDPYARSPEDLARTTAKIYFTGLPDQTREAERDTNS